MMKNMFSIDVKSSLLIGICSGVPAGLAGAGDNPHEQEVCRGYYTQQEEKGVPR